MRRKYWAVCTWHQRGVSAPAARRRLQVWTAACSRGAPLRAHSDPHFRWFDYFRPVNRLARLFAWAPRRPKLRQWSAAGRATLSHTHTPAGLSLRVRARLAVAAKHGIYSNHALLVIIISINIIIIILTLIALEHGGHYRPIHTTTFETYYHSSRARTHTNSQDTDFKRLVSSKPS